MGSSRSNSPYRLLVVSLASFGVPCVPFFSLSLVSGWSLGLWIPFSYGPFGTWERFGKGLLGFWFGPSRFIVWGVGFDIQRGGVLSGYSSKFLKLKQLLIT